MTAGVGATGAATRSKTRQSNSREQRGKFKLTFRDSSRDLLGSSVEDNLVLRSRARSASLKRIIEVERKKKPE